MKFASFMHDSCAMNFNNGKAKYVYLNKNMKRTNERTRVCEESSD